MSPFAPHEESAHATEKLSSDPEPAELKPSSLNRKPPPPPIPTLKPKGIECYQENILAYIKMFLLYFE